MKKHFSSHLVLLTLIFLVGCSPSSEAIQKAIEQTQTALPTNTSVSTEDEMQIEEQEQLYFQTMTPLFQKFVIDFEIANTKTQEIGQDIYIVLNDKNYKDGYYSSIDLVYSDLEELSLVPAP
ncbi:MAG TPA: hypothetical protein PLH64_01095, partial [Anaerolineaceae bacterium]|nr:hypothetical protein [Anaerolineaceae bacterium]